MGAVAGHKGGQDGGKGKIRSGASMNTKNALEKHQDGKTKSRNKYHWLACSSVAHKSVPKRLKTPLRSPDLSSTSPRPPASSRWVISSQICRSRREPALWLTANHHADRKKCPFLLFSHYYNVTCDQARAFPFKCCARSEHSRAEAIPDVGNVVHFLSDSLGKHYICTPVSLQSQQHGFLPPSITPPTHALRSLRREI